MIIDKKERFMMVDMQEYINRLLRPDYPTVYFSVYNQRVLFQESIRSLFAILNVLYEHGQQPNQIKQGTFGLIPQMIGDPVAISSVTVRKILMMHAPMLFSCWTRKTRAIENPVYWRLNKYGKMMYEEIMNAKQSESGE